MPSPASHAARDGRATVSPLSVLWLLSIVVLVASSMEWVLLASAQPGPGPARFELKAEWISSYGPGYGIDLAVPNFTSPYIYVLQPIYGHLFAVATDARTGATAWNVTVSRDDLAPLAIDGAISVPFAGGGNLVFIATAQRGNTTTPKVIALDSRTGLVKWIFAGEWDSYFKTVLPAKLTPGRGEYLVASLSRQLLLLNATTGQRVANFTFRGEQFLHSATRFDIGDRFIIALSGLPPLYFGPHHNIYSRIDIVENSSNHSHPSAVSLVQRWSQSYAASLNDPPALGPVIAYDRLPSGNPGPGEPMVIGAVSTLLLFNLSTGAVIASPSLDSFAASDVSFAAGSGRIFVPAFSSIAGFSQGGSLDWLIDLDFSYTLNSTSMITYANRPAVHRPSGVAFFTGTNFTDMGTNPALCAFWSHTGEMLGCMSEPFLNAGDGETGYPVVMSFDGVALYNRNASHIIRYRIVKPY